MELLVHGECEVCGSHRTAQKKNRRGELYYAWYYSEGVLVCLACYENIRYHRYRKEYYKNIANPRTHAKWNKHRINIKGIDRRYDLRVQRKGICAWCHKSVAKGDIKRTNLHHSKYHSDDILKDTVEICTHCHSRYNYGHVCDIKDRPTKRGDIIGSVNGPYSVSNLPRIRRKNNQRRI